MDQILDNLLENAVTYAPGAIELHTGIADGRAFLAVRDHGAGIAPAERSKVTERFYRGSNAPPGGSGLGLAIARDLAERWGGALSLQDAEGGGTRVEVRFRAASLAAPEKEGSMTPTPVGLWIDPGCPWAWQGAVWLRRLAERGRIALDWRLFSLELNALPPQTPFWEACERDGEALVALALARREGGNPAFERLYDAIGTPSPRGQAGTHSRRGARRLRTRRACGTSSTAPSS